MKQDSPIGECSDIPSGGAMPEAGMGVLGKGLTA